jgi:hypothetical protein
MGTRCARVREPHRSSLSLLVLFAACGGTSGKNSQGANPDSSGVLIVLPSSDALPCVNTASPPDAGASGPDPMCDPNAVQISYRQDIAPILVGCTGEVCHTAWTRDTLVNQPSRACCDRRLLVSPYHPSSSLFTQSLTGPYSCVGSMPQNGHLPSPEIQAMIAWVCQGALDN